METRSFGLFSLALKRLLRDRVAMVCWITVVGYLLLICLSSVGAIATTWNDEIAESYSPPSFTNRIQNKSQDNLPITREGENAEQQKEIETYLQGVIVDPLAENFKAAKKYSLEHPQTQITLQTSLPMGADRWGRDVLAKTLHGAQTSIVVGLGSAFLATLIGVMLGAIAGYMGGAMDALCDWLYSLFSAVPYLLLILAIAAVLGESGVKTMILIFGFTGWTGVYRLIRAETIRQRDREYVRAAQAMGVPHWQRIVRHILPNTNHIILVQISILSVGFIKSEVILSFLGFGVPVSQVSWGSMLNEAQNELLLGYWWQLVAVTVAMAGLITAWSLFTDALRDALDPKLK